MGTAARRLLLALCLIAAVCGCANTPLYNEARDRQGQALVAATSAVDLLAVVDELDKKYAALSEVEVSTLQARLATSRELEIARVATTTGDPQSLSLQSRYVTPVLEKRLKYLTGSALELNRIVELLQDAAGTDEEASLAVSAIRDFNAVSGLNIQDCTAARKLITQVGTDYELTPQALAAIAKSKQSAALVTLKNAIARCASDAGRSNASANGGLLGTLTARLQEDNKLIGTYRAQLREQQDRLAVKSREFSAEVAAIKPVGPDAGYRARLSDAAQKFGHAIDALSQAATDSGLAQAHAEALAKLDALEAVTGALSTGVSDPAKLSPQQIHALALVRLIPTVADEADKLLKDAQRPRLGPFLLAKEHQRLLVEGFQKNLALLDRKAATRQRQIDAARLELKALARARLVLGPPQGEARGATVDLSQPMATTVSAGSAQQRFALYSSFAVYFDEAYQHRLEQETLDLNIVAMSYDIEIEKSRTAALMWQNLVTNMASILSDYHSAGIKPADLAEFLKGFGLVYIGGRAAR